MKKSCFVEVKILFLFLFCTSCSYLSVVEENSVVLNSQDKEFLLQAGYYNRSQIDFSNLAILKSSNESISNYGTRITEIHTNAQNELLHLANLKNTEVPDTLNSFPRLYFNTLSAIEGNHFDSAYLHHQIVDFQDHKKLYERQVSIGLDKDIINYATQIIPVLNQNLEQALLLREELRKRR